MSLKFDASGEWLRFICCYAPQRLAAMLWGPISGKAWWSRESDWPGRTNLARRWSEWTFGGQKAEHEEDGGRSFGIRNKCGHMAVDFAETFDMAVVNTFFRKQDTHLITYTSGGHNIQVDSWLTRRSDLKFVTDAKVIPSVDIIPHYKLLSLNIHSDLRKLGNDGGAFWRTIGGASSSIEMCFRMLSSKSGSISLDVSQNLESYCRTDARCGNEHPRQNKTWATLHRRAIMVAERWCPMNCQGK